MLGEKRVLFAGFGGQGIIFMGKVLAQAVMKEGKNVTWMPSYGAEVRGGTAHSMVVISDKEIASPCVHAPDLCVVMNNPSLERFAPTVKKGGMLFVNSSLCDAKIKRKDIKIVRIQAAHIADKIGNARVANMVLVGLLIAKTGVCALETAVNCLDDLVPLHRKHLIPLNKKALIEGASFKSGKNKS